MPSGRLKKFVSDKGFGFITPDDGSPDVFAHTLQFSGDADSLRGGEKVTFDTEWDERKQKTRAVTWSVDFSASASAMRTGRLQRFFADKGFGFIQPDEGGDDIFAHSRQFTGGDPDLLKEGERVKFDAEWDEKKGNNKAVTWCLESGSQPGFGQPQGCGGQGNFGAPAYGGQGNFGAPMQGGYAPMGCPQNDPRFSPYGGGCGGCGGCGCGGYPQQGFGGGPAPNGAAGPLPPGWEQVTDPNSGRPYYCNRSTNETRWDPPPAVSPAPAPAPVQGGGGLPPGWEQVTDPQSGRPYYCNRSTGQTSWEPPQGQPQASPQPSPAPAAQPAPTSGSPALPQGWESATDPNSGKAYYFNRSTGETRWEPPA